MNPQKIEMVKNWLGPTNVLEIRSFLGLAGYYKKFVKDFSKIASPMTQLIRKDVPFEWDQKCEDCFLELKKRLVKATILTIP